MTVILQTTYSNTFSWLKTSEFQIMFHWNVFIMTCLIDKKRCIGSDNGLVPNRWHAIIWTSYGLIRWGIYMHHSVSIESEVKYKNFHSRKLLSKYCLQNGGHFVPDSMWSPMELLHCFCINLLKHNSSLMFLLHKNLWHKKKHLCSWTKIKIHNLNSQQYFGRVFDKKKRLFFYC